MSESKVSRLPEEEVLEQVGEMVQQSPGQRAPFGLVFGSRPPRSGSRWPRAFGTILVALQDESVGFGRAMGII